MAAVDSKHVARLVLRCALPLAFAYALVQPPLSGHHEAAHVAQIVQEPSQLQAWSESSAALLADEDARGDSELFKSALNELPPLYVARGASLVSFALLAAFAVYSAGQFAWLFAVLSLTPMALAAAATASLASLSNGLGLVFAALFLRAVRAGPSAADARALVRSRLLFALLIALLTLCKPAYALLALALLALPTEGGEGLRARFAPVGLSFALALPALLFSVLLDANMFQPFGGGSFWERFTFPLFHPVLAFHIARKTLFRQGDDVWLQLFGAHDVLSQQLRFLASTIAVCESCLLLSLAWGALHAQLSAEARRALTRFVALALGLTSLALVHSVYFSANEPRPRFLEQLDGGDFFPLLPLLCVALTARGHSFAARYLHKRPARRVLWPMLALNAWYLLSLIARFWLPPTLNFPY